jgi:hypothetical protein
MANVNTFLGQGRTSQEQIGSFAVADRRLYLAILKRQIHIGGNNGFFIELHWTNHLHAVDQLLGRDLEQQ